MFSLNSNVQQKVMLKCAYTNNFNRSFVVDVYLQLTINLNTQHFGDVGGNQPHKQGEHQNPHLNRWSGGHGSANANHWCLYAGFYVFIFILFLWVKKTSKKKVEKWRVWIKEEGSRKDDIEEVKRDLLVSSSLLTAVLLLNPGMTLLFFYLLFQMLIVFFYILIVLYFIVPLCLPFFCLYSQGEDTQCTIGLTPAA